MFETFCHNFLLTTSFRRVYANFLQPGRNAHTHTHTHTHTHEKKKTIQSQSSRASNQNTDDVVAIAKAMFNHINVSWNRAAAYAV